MDWTGVTRSSVGLARGWRGGADQRAQTRGDPISFPSPRLYPGGRKGRGGRARRRRGGPLTTRRRADRDPCRARRRPCCPRGTSRPQPRRAKRMRHPPRPPGPVTRRRTALGRPALGGGSEPGAGARRARSEEPPKNFVAVTPEEVRRARYCRRHEEVGAT